MGTEIPEIPELPLVPAGDPCFLYWGPDAIFGDVPTPSKVTVIFSGINRGPNWTVLDPQPPDGEFVLLQSLGFPCAFELITFNFTVRAVWGVAGNSLLITNTAPGDLFRGMSGPVGTLFYLNKENDIMAGGSGTIILPGTI